MTRLFPALNHRRFIGLVVSAAVGISAMAAPARADVNDYGKILAGLTLLAIIGKAIDDDNKGRHVTRNTYHNHTYKQQPVRPKPLPPQVSSRYDLPGHCLKTFRTNGRDSVRLFGRKCLQQNYRHTNSLPYACQFQFDRTNRSQTGYEPRCLRERGYRVARN